MNNKKSAISIIVLLLVGILTYVTIEGSFLSGDKRTDSVRLLAWVGYDEEEVIKEFEKRSEYSLQVETFFGADKMFAKLSQNPSTYDAVVIDPEYISKLSEADLIRSLDESKFDFSHYYREFKKFEPCYIDGNLECVVVRFGSSGLMYNDKYLNKEDVDSYKVLWKEKYKNRIGTYDFYLPNIGQVSLKRANEDPFNITDKEFNRVKKELNELKPQIRKIHGGARSLLSSFESGDIWITMLGGESFVSLLRSKGVPAKWTIPKEGGLVWFESIGVTSGAENVDGAYELIRFLQSPKGQHLLMKRDAYNSNAPSKKAVDMLSAEERKIRHVPTDSAYHALLKKLTPRSLPSNQTESEWQNAWNEFKSQ